MESILDVEIDTITPSLADLTIYSNNANPSLATVNNNLTITITANENLKAANITILGSTYTMSVNDAVATANVTVSQDSAEGDVSFNITAIDLAGKAFAVPDTIVFIKRHYRPQHTWSAKSERGQRQR